GCVAGAERLLERFAIHVRDHAHLAGQAILSHGRHEAGLGVELEVHGARERSRALRHCLTARPEDGVVPSNARALERHPPSARNGWERAKRKTAARAGPAVATLGASAPAAYGGRRGVVQCEEGPGPRVSLRPGAAPHASLSQPLEITWGSGWLGSCFLAPAIPPEIPHDTDGRPHVARRFVVRAPRSRLHRVRANPGGQRDRSRA